VNVPVPAPPNLLLGYPGHEMLIPDIVRASGCHLWDTAGKRYVDLESGVWCTALGHGHPALLRTIAEQGARIAHAGFGYSSPVVARAAGEILDLLGFSGGRCVFLCSGSEAVEYGVRVARMLIDRPLLLTMADAYFGAYGAASIRPPDQWYAFDWSACAPCPHDAPCGSHCPRWAAIPLDKLGGFVFEPGSSSGLVHFPPAKLVTAIAEQVRRNGGLIVVNEVTTGIGRTGRWFGFQHYGLVPDIVAMGKGLGNGYPVSAAAIGPTAAARLGDRPVPYAQSHQNDPLGAAVAREVIRIIRRKDLIARSRPKADFLLAGLEEIGRRSGKIRALRARGLMIAVELEDEPVAIRVHRELARRGYVAAHRPGLNLLRLDPSLTIEMTDIEGFLTALAEILATHDTAAGSAAKE
jgi:acetylornithine/N-succinyldiaminopimelate aminotransferase